MERDSGCDLAGAQDLSNSWCRRSQSSKQGKPWLLPKDLDWFSVLTLTCHLSLLLGNSNLLRFEKHQTRQVTDVELSRKLKLFKYFSLFRLVRERLGLGVKRKKGELLLKQNRKSPGKRKVHKYQTSIVMEGQEAHCAFRVECKFRIRLRM